MQILLDALRRSLAQSSLAGSKIAAVPVSLLKTVIEKLEQTDDAKDVQ